MRRPWPVLLVGLLSLHCGSAAHTAGEAGAEAVSCAVALASIRALADEVRDDFASCQTDADCVGVPTDIRADGAVCLQACGVVAGGLEEAFLSEVRADGQLVDACAKFVGQDCADSPIGDPCDAAFSCDDSGRCGPSIVSAAS